MTPRKPAAAICPTSPAGSSDAGWTEGKGTRRGPATAVDQRRIEPNCPGSVAIEQTTAAAMPARSIEASSAPMVPSRAARTAPWRSRWAIARPARWSGKACVWKSMIDGRRMRPCDVFQAQVSRAAGSAASERPERPMRRPGLRAPAGDSD